MPMVDVKAGRLFGQVLPAPSSQIKMARLTIETNGKRHRSNLRAEGDLYANSHWGRGVRLRIRDTKDGRGHYELYLNAEEARKLIADLSDIFPTG